MCPSDRNRSSLTLLSTVLLTALVVLSIAGTAVAQDAPSLTQASVSIPSFWYIAPIAAVIALFMAYKFYKEVMAADEGDPLMKEIAGYVRAGAMAYLFRQYKVVVVVFIGLSAILAFMAFGLKVQHEIVPLAFLTGGFFSGLCGWFGMKMATNAAHRTTAGARRSLNDGLVVAFRAGAVMGMVVVGFGLIDITGWFFALHYIAPKLGLYDMTLNEITVVMLTFGMGASTQALFARVGGGIYTKAADVGADLVGKVEAGIPEDDPRNPAAIADNVGDNVGDVAGMGADLYESYCGSILATMALGVAAASALFTGSAEQEGAAIRLLSVPMIMAGVGILLSIIGVYLVKTREGATMGQLMKALERGVNSSSVLIAIAAFGICYFLLGPGHSDGAIEGVRWWGIALAVVIGLFAGVGIGKFTEYYTSYEYKPTQEIAEQALTGAATVIIAGVAEGMKSTWASLTIIIIAILGAFIAAQSGYVGVSRSWPVVNFLPVKQVDINDRWYNSLGRLGRRRRAEPFRRVAAQNRSRARAAPAPAARHRRRNIPWCSRTPPPATGAAGRRRLRGRCR